MKKVKTIALTTNQMAIIKCAIMACIREDENEIQSIQDKSKLSSIDNSNIEAINLDIGRLKEIIEVLNG